MKKVLAFCKKEKMLVAPVIGIPAVELLRIGVTGNVSPVISPDWMHTVVWVVWGLATITLGIQALIDMNKTETTDAS